MHELPSAALPYLISSFLDSSSPVKNTNESQWSQGQDEASEEECGILTTFFSVSNTLEPHSPGLPFYDNNKGGWATDVSGTI